MEKADLLDERDFLFGDRRTQETALQSNNSARDQWLQANRVRTEFFDAGIGACWFAGQGEAEADMVCSDTEEGAIALLARRNGLPLWDEAAP